jgi:hypothetical protein
MYEKVNMLLSTLNPQDSKFFPSDGVVLVKSQLAFPGVGNRIDKMEGDNHFQMRNFEETRRVMENLKEIL